MVNVRTRLTQIKKIVPHFKFICYNCCVEQIRIIVPHYQEAIL